MPLETPKDTIAKAPKSKRPTYKDEGKAWPSVTTILHVIDAPALDKWRVRQALKGIDSYEDFSAADTGTLLHAVIAHHLDPEGQPAPAIAEWPAPVALAARNSYKGYLAWRKDHTVRPILLEHSMASAALGYAGTPDFYGEVDGHLEVVDWKTSARVYPEYFIQTAAYAQLLHAKYPEHTPFRLRVICFSKDKPGTYTEDVIEVPECGDHLKAFGAALTIMQAQARIAEAAVKRKAPAFTPPLEAGDKCKHGYVPAAACPYEAECPMEVAP